MRDSSSADDHWWPLNHAQISVTSPVPYLNAVLLRTLDTFKHQQVPPGPARYAAKKYRPGLAQPGDWKARQDPVSKPTADTNQNTILQSACWM